MVMRHPWQLFEDDAYAYMVEAGVPEVGHHRLKSRKHTKVKMIFRRLLEPRNADILLCLDRALAYCAHASTLEHGLEFDCLAGLHTGGLLMAQRIAPLLCELRGLPSLPVIDNYHWPDDRFQFLTRPSELAHCRFALRFDDAVTTGTSQQLFEEELQRTYAIKSVAGYAYVNREGKTATDLGLKFFGPLVDRLFPSYDVDNGEACPECVAGRPFSPHH